MFLKKSGILIIRDKDRAEQAISGLFDIFTGILAFFIGLTIKMRPKI